MQSMAKTDAYAPERGGILHALLRDTKRISSCVEEYMKTPRIQRRVLAVLAGMLVVAGSNCASTARAEQPAGPGKGVVINAKEPAAAPVVAAAPVKAEPVLASR